MLLNPYFTRFPRSFYSIDLSFILRHLSFLFQVVPFAFFFCLPIRLVLNLLGNPNLPMASTINQCSTTKYSLICACTPDFHPWYRGSLEVFKCPSNLKIIVSKLEFIISPPKSVIPPEFPLYLSAYVNQKLGSHQKIPPDTVSLKSLNLTWEIALKFTPYFLSFLI